MTTGDLCRWVVLTALACLATCVSEVGDETAQVELNSAPLRLRRDCNDTKASVYEAPNGSQNRPLGEIVRCARGRRIPVAEIAQGLADRDFRDITARKAVNLFRIAYQTTRADGQADLATALVALPAKNANATLQTADTDDDNEDTTQAGKRTPLIVFAHGTAPYGNKCALSKRNPMKCSKTSEKDTELLSIIAFATQGHPVIAPDYAGYVKGSRAPGYLLAEDEARSVLDAARAMNKLRQKAVDKVVLVGHSQGGHAVLSAQAIARSYGLDGKLVGVASMAPIWAPMRLLGVIGLDPVFGTDPAVQSFIVEYFYTHGEVLDGVGQGIKLFNPDKRDAIRDHIKECTFNEDICQFINPLDVGLASEFLRQDFFEAVSGCGADKTLCGADSSPLAPTWAQRFAADRPTLDRKGAPIVLWHGANDLVIPPPFASCAKDTIETEFGMQGSTATFKFCGDNDANHDQILSHDLAWVTRWAEARALGTPEPNAQQCTGYQDWAKAYNQTELSGYLPIPCPEPPSPVNVD